MKFSPRSSRLALAVSLTVMLSACGGHNSVSVGGKVSGLTSDGLVLSNNGTTLAIPANATSYTFPNSVNVDSLFAVTIQSAPTHQTCALANSSGRVSGTQIDYVNVTCIQTRHALSGTISGFSGATGSLVLANGPIAITPAGGSTTFAFPPVADGTAYGITVPTQPTGQTCTVVGGTGTMDTSDITTVQINCV